MLQTANSGRVLRSALRNPLIVMLDLLFGILVISCLINGAYRAAAYTAGFLLMLKLVFIASSVLLSRYGACFLDAAAPPMGPDSVSSPRILRVSGLILLIFGSIPVFLLFFKIGLAPGFEAIFVLDYDLLILLRSSSFYIMKGINLYYLEYALRAFLPLGTFFLFLSGSSLFIPSLIFAILLSMSVIAKIYPILLISPLIIYCAFSQRYIMSLIFGLTLVGVLSFQITTTNPSLKLPILVTFDSATRDYIIARSETLTDPQRKEPYPMLKTDELLRQKLAERVGLVDLTTQAVDPVTDRYAMELARRNAAKASGNSSKDFWRDILETVAGGFGTAIYKSVEALYDRTVLVPGEVMRQWFSTIPSQQPYLGLCGYRVIALAMGCEYIHSPRRVFEIVYADSYVKRGIVGNLNAPGFLMDYANLGWIGVGLSALLLGFMIAIFSTIFAGSAAFLAVLMPYFALTTEAPISMILNSGGLGIAAIILFLMHRHIPTKSSLVAR